MNTRILSKLSDLYFHVCFVRNTFPVYRSFCTSLVNQLLSDSRTVKFATNVFANSDGAQLEAQYSNNNDIFSCTLSHTFAQETKTAVGEGNSKIDAYKDAAFKMFSNQNRKPDELLQIVKQFTNPMKIQLQAKESLQISKDRDGKTSCELLWILPQKYDPLPPFLGNGSTDVEAILSAKLKVLCSSEIRKLCSLSQKKQLVSSDHLPSSHSNPKINRVALFAPIRQLYWSFMSSSHFEENMRKCEVDAANMGGVRCHIKWINKKTNRTFEVESCEPTKQIAESDSMIKMLALAGRLKCEPSAEEKWTLSKIATNLKEFKMEEVLESGKCLLSSMHPSMWALFLPAVWTFIVTNNEKNQRRLAFSFLDYIESMQDKEITADVWMKLMEQLGTCSDVCLSKEVIKRLKKLKINSDDFFCSNDIDYFKQELTCLVYEDLESLLDTIHNFGTIAKVYRCAVAPWTHPLITLFLTDFITIRESSTVLLFKDPPSGSLPQMHVGIVRSIKQINNQTTVCIELSGISSLQSGDLNEGTVCMTEADCVTISTQRAQQAICALVLKDRLSDTRGVFSFSQEFRTMLTKTATAAAKEQMMGSFFTKEKSLLDSDSAMVSVGEDVATIVKTLMDSVKHREYGSYGIHVNRIAKLRRLTPRQLEGVVRSMHQRLTVIQGPPGTGKTHTSASIVEVWLALEGSREGKILVVAESNVGADNLILKLDEFDVPALRFGQTLSGIEEKWLREHRSYEDYKDMIASGRFDAAAQLRSYLSNKVVPSIPVIVTTCIGSGCDQLRKYAFSRIIIDESSQCMASRSLVAMGQMCSRMVLIGDQKQLPPTIVSRESQNSEASQSIFERFIVGGVSPILLNIQRRTHSSIMEFPNKEFYNGLIEQGVCDTERPIVEGIDWPNPECRVAFIESNSRERMYGRFSYSNPEEANQLIEYLKNVLNKDQSLAKKIGILSPYVGQTRLLKDLVRSELNSIESDIRVNSIDGFQGMEKDLILFSSVRSKDKLGFLSDARRMNVMLTRARRGLVVFGNSNVMKQSPLWARWLKWIENNQVKKSLSVS
eukprot:GHVL01044391.1.p1 GENE.GHVL01044391.1~~GHVL01044391.1.p1  ORF type:complete len:1058 (-),score=142.65 GHVL01044391.1:3504-6677(-)